jgi:hypothetical protein
MASDSTSTSFEVCSLAYYFLYSCLFTSPAAPLQRHSPLPRHVNNGFRSRSESSLLTLSCRALNGYTLPKLSRLFLPLPAPCSLAQPSLPSLPKHLPWQENIVLPDPKSPCPTDLSTSTVSRSDISPAINVDLVSYTPSAPLDMDWSTPICYPTFTTVPFPAHLPDPSLSLSLTLSLTMKR